MTTTDGNCTCGRHCWRDGRWWRRYVVNGRPVHSNFSAYSIGVKWYQREDGTWFPVKKPHKLKPCRGCGQDVSRPPGSEAVTQ